MLRPVCRGAVADGIVDGRHRGVVRPVGVVVPEPAATRRLPGVSRLRVAEPGALRNRRRVRLHDDLVRAVGVAVVQHRLTNVQDGTLDVCGLRRDARRREVRLHVRVVVAVVRPPGRREQEVLDAGLHDVGEPVVVRADEHRDGLHVVRRRELLQHQRLTLVPARVAVEVEPGLEVTRSRRLRVGARTGAGQVHAVHATTDVDLGRLRAVAAVDLLGGVGRVVVVRGRAERVDVRRAAVRVAGPATRLAGDRRVADAHDPGRSHAGAVGVRRRGSRGHHRGHDGAEQHADGQLASHRFPPVRRRRSSFRRDPHTRSAAVQRSRCAEIGQDAAVGVGPLVQVAQHVSGLDRAVRFTPGSIEGRA